MPKNDNLPKVTLDSEGCIGCGMCVSMSSLEGNEIFDWNDNNKAMVANQPENQEQLDWVKQDVIPACPVDVIKTDE